MPNQVFVSPGVYTSERDLTFITRNVGVTTLGMVGETKIGPAFQPIFITNYGEFQSFFGGLDATIVKDNGAPKYELPYIAKSYLSQSNQLFVTRVLGLTGYKPGHSFGIKTIGGVIPTGTTVGIISDGSNITAISTVTNSANNITLQVGSVTNPSLNFLSNLTTGLYVPSSNTIGFASNGTQAATLGPSGLFVANGISGGSF